MTKFLDRNSDKLDADARYALKVVQLDRNIKSKQIDHLQGEKKSLQLMQGSKGLFPTLKATFIANQQYACFVMTPIEGISIHDYQREQISVPIDIVKYFSAVAL